MPACAIEACYNKVKSFNFRCPAITNHNLKKHLYKNQDPAYFHEVVDCQKACPAGTPVPEYIRLTAAGEYDSAYAINRQSNIFPGILGRICDRPCEPACRRGRLDEEGGGKAVAICRIKRFAADNANPKSPQNKIEKHKTSKRIAIIGGGPAGLACADILLDHGMHVELFDKGKQLGGAIRTDVPAFRLPESVLDFEIQAIVDRGLVHHRENEVGDVAPLLDQFDAVVVATGSPKGRKISLEGESDANASASVPGVEFLRSVHYGHCREIQGPVVVIGGGNTAMDCARSALRLGASTVTVVAGEQFDAMPALDWEIEESQEEGVGIVNGFLPEKILASGEQKILAGDNDVMKVRFRQVSSLVDSEGRFSPQFVDIHQDIDAARLIWAIGQDTPFNMIPKGMPLQWEESGMPKLHPETLESSVANLYFTGDAAWGPRNMITAVALGKRAAYAIIAKQKNKAIAFKVVPKVRTQRSSQIALQQFDYDATLHDIKRREVPKEPLPEALKSISKEVEKGFTPEQLQKEAKRCLNCDIHTVFEASSCIECDACIDICPVKCLSIESKSLEEPQDRAQKNATLFSAGIGGSVNFMNKDEDICIHCGLCAAKCPTNAWDMQKVILELVPEDE